MGIAIGNAIFVPYISFFKPIFYSLSCICIFISFFLLFISPFLCLSLYSSCLNSLSLSLSLFSVFEFLFLFLFSIFILFIFYCSLYSSWLSSFSLFFPFFSHAHIIICVAYSQDKKPYSLGSDEGKEGISFHSLRGGKWGDIHGGIL